MSRYSKGRAAGRMPGRGTRPMPQANRITPDQADRDDPYPNSSSADLAWRYGAVAVCRWTMPPSSRCQETSRQPAAVTCWASSGGECQAWMDSAR